MNVGKELTFRTIQSGEETKVCQLVMESFHEFVAPDYSAGGNSEFSKYVKPQSIPQRLTNNHFILVALDKEIFTGMIEVRNYNHISLLFVKKEYHHQGIAKKLLQIAIDKCRKCNPDLALIDVDSSPFAVTIYEKMGFLKVDTEQVKTGIRFTPMMKRLV